MIEQGYIRIHRSLLKWEWYEDANTMRVFIHLLLNAQWEDIRYRGIDIPKGSLIIGRKKLAKELGISEKSVRTSLNHLKSTNEVAIKSTNEYSLVTIVNWEKYQCFNSDVASESANEVASNGPATGQQRATNKEYNNNNNNNIDIYTEIDFRDEIQELFNKTCIYFKPCTVITKNRSDKMKKLINQFSLEDIRVVFEKANNNSFLQGKNEKGWSASFDWLIEPDNFVKVLEGNFDKQEEVNKEPKANFDANKGLMRGNYNFEELEAETKNRHLVVKKIPKEKPAEVVLSKLQKHILSLPVDKDFHFEHEGKEFWGTRYEKSVSVMVKGGDFEQFAIEKLEDHIEELPEFRK